MEGRFPPVGSGLRGAARRGRPVRSAVDWVAVASRVAVIRAGRLVVIIRDRPGEEKGLLMEEQT
ncbi:hypothetical protein Misp01_78840 [Microtetraspora sp. NBRC 13810]|nr:hypothetical protein Misp01_78840 [Microtetraspora sp. NBRC 13810]